MRWTSSASDMKSIFGPEQSTVNLKQQAPDTNGASDHPERHPIFHKRKPIKFAGIMLPMHFSSYKQITGNDYCIYKEDKSVYLF